MLHNHQELLDKLKPEIDVAIEKWLKEELDAAGAEGHRKMDLQHRYGWCASPVWGSPAWDELHDLWAKMDGLHDKFHDQVQAFCAGTCPKPDFASSVKD